MSQSESSAASAAESERDERRKQQAGVSSTAASEDASPLVLVLTRDAVILVAVFSIWGGAEAWAQVSGIGFATGLSTLGGLLVGAVFVALVHEWGHYTGARLSGAVAPLGSVKRLPVFDFDMERSSDEQFRAMSLGGNIAHWVAALFLLLALPDLSPGLVAVQASALGFVTFASVIEVPVLRSAFAGASRHEAFALITQEPRAVLQRAGRIGLAATLLIFLLL